MASAETDLLQQLLGLQPTLERDVSHKGAVLVCIDCEAWEEDHSKITEIGAAVLDPGDVMGLDPGVNAQQWTAQIKAVHLRPVEYASLVNRKYVKGREEFFNFGTTYWIDLDQSTTILERIFKTPTALEVAIHSIGSSSGPTRPIILVAHDIRTDLRFIDQLGFSLSRAENIAHRIDTQRVAGATKKNKIGLQRLLHGLGIKATNLHNAGNDATYTLQSLIVMAVREFQDPGAVSQALERVRREKLPPAAVDDSNPALHLHIGRSQERIEEDTEARESVESSSLSGTDRGYGIESSYRKRPASDTECHESSQEDNDRSKRLAVVEEDEIRA